MGTEDRSVVTPPDAKEFSQPVNSNGTGGITQPSLASRMHGVLAPGSTFGVYLVGDCIGEGGMARIYRAEHAGLRRQVALKVLLNGFSTDPGGRERFLREARIAAAIKHPNVVNIFDVGVHEEIPYFVMELLEGTDLEKLVAQKGALDEELILEVMVPVAAGLCAVHDACIIHRDLKPGNIFLAEGGRYDYLEPKLLDFGISKTTGPEQMRLTKDHGQLMGTPFYMSPEGVQGAELTALSDQYSLGVVLYECATGHAPFQASTLQEVAQMIVRGDYVPPSERNPRLSPSLCRIIARAMSLDPGRRFANLREMGRELLMLAGQRTQITWGLTFRDADLRPAPVATDAAPRLPAAPPAAPTAPVLPSLLAGSKPRWRRTVAWTMVGLMSVALLSWLIGLHERPSELPAGRPPRQREVPRVVIDRVVPSLPPDAPPPASMSVSSSQPAARAPEAESVRAAPRRRAARPPVRKPSPPERAPAGEQKSDDRPEWALPGASSVTTPGRARETRPGSHPNGAPLFD